jgi:hypothetical protein
MILYKNKHRTGDPGAVKQKGDTMTNTIPPAPRTGPAKASATPGRAILFGSIPEATGHRVLLYGPGGIGKTTLAANAPGPVAFFDLDESLPRLRNLPVNAEDGTASVKYIGPDGCRTWAGMMGALASPGWDAVKTVVIDTVTKAEELCVLHVLDTIPHEKGHRVERLEDYGWGKGYTHVYEAFLHLLVALDVHARAGRNVVLIAHDCTTSVPNPAGDDWLRFEPRLQSPGSGKGSVRLRVREWADHVLYLGYDVAVTKDGKGKGHGSRTIYPSELPHCMAKSRTVSDPIPVTNLNVLSAIIG